MPIEAKSGLGAPVAVIKRNGTAATFQAAKIVDALASAGLKPENAEVTMKASTDAEITDIEQAEKLMKMIDMLEDLDDVQNVYSNANFSDAVMAALNA